MKDIIYHHSRCNTHNKAIVCGGAGQGGIKFSLRGSAQSLSRILDEIARITEFKMVLNSLPMTQNVCLVT